MLCCLQQLYCSKGIYLGGTEPRGGQSEFESFSRFLWQKLSNAVGLLPPPPGSTGQRKNFLLLFPLVCPLAPCLVLAEGSETSNIPPFFCQAVQPAPEFCFHLSNHFLKDIELLQSWKLWGIFFFFGERGCGRLKWGPEQYDSCKNQNEIKLLQSQRNFMWPWKLLGKQVVLALN